MALAVQNASPRASQRASPCHAGPSAPAVLAAPPSPASVATAGEPTTAPKTAPAMPASTGSPAPSATSSAASVHAATPAEPPSLPVSQPVFNAAYLDNPAPAYPVLSRRAGEQGHVLLRVLVNAAGRADEVQVRGSSGSTRLDEAACNTVRRWRFEPARRGEQAVPAWVLIPVSFSLGG